MFCFKHRFKVSPGDFLSASVLPGAAHYAVNAKHVRNISIYFASGHKPSQGPCYICFVNNDVKTASCPSSLLPVP